MDALRGGEMKNNIPSLLDGRVVLSVLRGTYRDHPLQTNIQFSVYCLRVGLDTADERRLLDQRGLWGGEMRNNIPSLLDQRSIWGTQ